MPKKRLQIAEEFMHAPFADHRLTKRLPDLAESLAATPEKSIWGSCRTPADAKGIYRFMDNDKVTPGKCLVPHRRKTIERVSGHRRVLIIQDTTALDYATHKNAELGPYTTEPNAKGILMHSSLAVADGVPLGLLAQQIWTRTPETRGKRHQRKALPSVQKESHKWIDGLHQSIKGLPEKVEAVFVCDREADVYDFMHEVSKTRHHFLIRAVQNRRTDAGTNLYDQVHAQPTVGNCWVEVARRPDREPRKAWLELRFTNVTLLPPLHRNDLLPEINLFAVLATEGKPPEGEKPVEWLLLTDLPVKDAEDAMRMLGWYRERWLIERFHFVLKSGCQVERLQLGNLERLSNALAVYSVIAWKISWLLYQSRKAPEASCELVLSRMEYELAYRYWYNAKPPDSPPTLAEAVLLIARLGGFKTRKNDGNPGPKVLWWGMDKLNTICQTARTLPPNPVKDMGKD